MLRRALLAEQAHKHRLFDQATCHSTTNSPQDLLQEMGSNEVARRCLLPAMMSLFGRTHLWGQASNFFALLVEGCGEQSWGCLPAFACQEPSLGDSLLLTVCFTLHLSPLSLLIS
jgi:hypothetical protein